MKILLNAENVFSFHFFPSCFQIVVLGSTSDPVVIFCLCIGDRDEVRLCSDRFDQSVERFVL